MHPYLLLDEISFPGPKFYTHILSSYVIPNNAITLSSADNVLSSSKNLSSRTKNMLSSTRNILFSAETVSSRTEKMLFNGETCCSVPKTRYPVRKRIDGAVVSASDC